MISRIYRGAMVLSTAFVAAVGIPTVANASAYQCKCMPGMSHHIAYNNSDENRYKCVEDWDSNNTGHDTGGFNNNVKFSFPDAVVKGDTTNVKFAARNLPGQCMNNASQYTGSYVGTDESKWAAETRWAGGKCDDANLNVNGWVFDTPNTQWGSGFSMTQITGEMKTTSAHNHFAAFYHNASDGKHLIGVCAD